MSYIKVPAVVVIQACFQAAEAAQERYSTGLETKITKHMDSAWVSLGWFKGKRRPTRTEAIIAVCDRDDDNFPSAEFFLRQRLHSTVNALQEIRKQAKVACTLRDDQAWVWMDTEDIALVGSERLAQEIHETC